MAEPHRHGQRAGPGAAAGGVQPIVREAGDLANAVFDRRGRMVAQAVTGTPGPHQLARPGRHGDPRRVPDRLARPRATSSSPTTRTRRPASCSTSPCSYPVFGATGGVIAFFGSTIHHTDVGGYGIGAGGPRRVRGRPVDPDLQADAAPGERNDDVWKFILSNVRQPDHMAGDLHAQMASGEVGAQRLQALCDRHGLDDIEALADEIIERSEAATRASIRELPAGTYRGEAELDLADGSRDRHRLRDHGRRRRRRDPRRLRRARRAPARSASTSSATTPTPTRRSRCARCSTRSSRTTTAAWRRSRSIAPVGSIVNAVSPQPCTARHVVGMFLPNALLKALAQIKPEQSMAEGSGAVWTMQVSGNHDDGSPFITAMFTYAGGVGARAAKPGLRRARTRPAWPRCRSRSSRPRRRSASCARSCGPGSGGVGRQTGGLGQTIEFTVDTERAVAAQRRHVAPGGGPRGHLRRRGRRGRIVHRQRRAGHHPGPRHAAARRRQVRLDLPGGGGYGAADREPEGAART